jgi:hypothetical protein
MQITLSLFILITSTIATTPNWQFSADWSLPHHIHSTHIKPDVSCIDQVLSVFTDYKSTTTVQLFPNATAIHSKHLKCEKRQYPNTTCNIRASWNLSCLVSCEKYCPQPTPELICKPLDNHPNISACHYHFLKPAIHSYLPLLMIIVPLIGIALINA